MVSKWSVEASNSWGCDDICWLWHGYWHTFQVYVFLGHGYHTGSGFLVRKMHTGHQLKVTLQGSARAPPVSSRTEQQTLVLLLVWCPFTALRCSQHIIVGLLLFLYASEKNRSVTPRMCTMLMEMELWTLTEFQVQSFITSSDKDTDNKGLLGSQQLSPLVLLWPCWDFHLHQSWFRTSLWWLIAPLIFNKVY